MGIMNVGHISINQFFVATTRNEKNCFLLQVFNVYGVWE